MSNDSISLTDLADRLATAITLKGQNDPACEDAWKQVPVGIRAALANVALTISGQKTSIDRIAKTARFSRPSFLRADAWRTLKQALDDHPDALAALVGGGADSNVVEQAVRDSEIRKRDATIAGLRAEVARLTAIADPLRAIIQEQEIAIADTLSPPKTPVAPHLTIVDSSLE